MVVQAAMIVMMQATIVISTTIIYLLLLVVIVVAVVFTNPGPRMTHQKARCKLEARSQDDVVSWACLRLSLDCLNSTCVHFRCKQAYSAAPYEAQKLSE